MVTKTGSLRGHADSTGKNSTEYREYICSEEDFTWRDSENLGTVTITSRGGVNFS